MKKVLAIVLAAVMVLSCSMVAFAEIKVNGETKYNPGTETPATEVTVNTANKVLADEKGDKLTVTGNVDGDLNDSNPSVKGMGGRGDYCRRRSCRKEWQECRSCHE